MSDSQTQRSPRQILEDAAREHLQSIGLTASEDDGLWAEANGYDLSEILLLRKEGDAIILGRWGVNVRPVLINERTSLDNRVARDLIRTNRYGEDTMTSGAYEKMIRRRGIER